LFLFYQLLFISCKDNKKYIECKIIAVEQVGIFFLCPACFSVEKSVKSEMPDVLPGVKRNFNVMIGRTLCYFETPLQIISSNSFGF
jgi:hypothetical protein